MKSKDKKEVILHCSFCSRHQNDTHRLIAASPSVCICTDCVEMANAIFDISLPLLRRESSIKSEMLRMANENDSPNLRCSFCHKRRMDVRGLVSGSSTTWICEECSEAVYKLLLEEEADAREKSN